MQSSSRLMLSLLFCFPQISYSTSHVVLSCWFACVFSILARLFCDVTYCILQTSISLTSLWTSLHPRNLVIIARIKIPTDKTGSKFLKYTYWQVTFKFEGKNGIKLLHASIIHKINLMSFAVANEMAKLISWLLSLIVFSCPYKHLMHKTNILSLV